MAEATIAVPVGTARPSAPEKLVIAVLLADSALAGSVRGRVGSELGDVDWASELLDFGFTRYYEDEMGSRLFRLFLSLKELVDPAELARLKLATNALERDFTVGGRRRVNLDPGLLSSSRFILASTKDSSHRVPLGGGIYAEVTLMFERGAWRPVEWTYPDYASDAYREILREVRARYLAELRTLQAARTRGAGNHV